MIDATTYKPALEAALTEITEELRAIGIINPRNPGDWIATPDTEGGDTSDPNVVADVAEDWAERRSTLSELEIRYANIVRALKKIEEGTYGICEIGGEEIAEDRLNAHPAARTCATHMNQEKQLPL